MIGEGDAESRPDELRIQQRLARNTFLAALGSATAIAVGYWWIVRRPDGYEAFTQAAQFAGTAPRFMLRVDAVAGGLSYEDARRALWALLGFSLLWGGIGTWLLWNHWAGAWKAGWGRKVEGKTLGLVFGFGAAMVAAVEKGLTLALLDDVDGRIRYAQTWADWGPKTILTLAWIKWMLAAGLILLAVAMVVSSATAFLRSGLKRPGEGIPDDDQLPPLPDPDNPHAPAGIGICCSGGGLRAAGFALGALAKLEEEPAPNATEPDGSPAIEVPSAPGTLGVIGRARYLASVSGGGYAAAAWRIAAGVDQLPSSPIIGDPNDPTLDGNPDDPLDKPRIRSFPPPDEAAKDMVQHVRERQKYLANGPGGLLRSAVSTFGRTAFHFTLVLLLVFVLAWPMGRVLVSWAVTDAGRADGGLPDELGYGVELHHWLPPLVLAGLAVGLSIVRLFLERTTVRTGVDLAIKGLLGLAALEALVLLVTPWTLDIFLRILPGSTGQVAVAGLWGAIVTAVWQLAAERLKPVARYLGGVGLAVGLAVFGLWIMANAASTTALLSNVYVWLGGCGLLAIAFIFFNPDRWSLHGVYRRGLAGTFATKLTDGGLIPHPSEPAIHEYRNALGPSPVICCAAAREDRRHTGIPVLSMTFEPECITLYRWTGAGRLEPKQISHAQFQRRLPHNPHGHHLHTLMGAASISGAAVAPSLGRMDMRSTNALLAAFNARLGVWVPNPAQQKYVRSTTPRLVNMFKEITRTYDPNDPNIYATDGGHWENLGLVELIRRRCSTIIVIDTSGDPPGTYHTLKQAMRLAELECEATVELTDESWEQLAVDDDGVVTANHGRGTVTYSDETTADLIYVKSAISLSSPLHIQRYAATDTRFPNYSTIDQLLTSEELSYLMQLGHFSMGEALGANRDAVAKAFAELAEPI